MIVLAIQGVPGSMKSTTIQKVKSMSNAEIKIAGWTERVEHFEDVRGLFNPLKEFYDSGNLSAEERELRAVRMQLVALSDMVSRCWQAYTTAVEDGCHVLLLERDIDSWMIFARAQLEEGIISEKTYQSMELLHESIVPHVVSPDLTVLLDVDAAVAKQRIESRGRESEKAITLDYLDTLAFVHRARLRSNVVCLNCDTSDLAAALLYNIITVQLTDGGTENLPPPDSVRL